MCILSYSNGVYTPTYLTGFIAPGGYDVNNTNPIVDAINTFFTSFTANGSNPLNKIQCVFDSTTALIRFDFSHWVRPSTLYGFYFIDTPTSIMRPLGFESSQTTNPPGLNLSGWLVGENGLVSTGIPQMNTQDIILKIDQFNTHNRASGFGIGEIFHVIHPNCTFGDIIDYQPYINFTSQIPRLNLEGLLTVRFVDWDNHEIDWNGQDWTLTLGIQWAVDTGIAGLETVQFNQNLRPLTNHYPDNYDSLDVGGRERKRKLRL